MGGLVVILLIVVLLLVLKKPKPPSCIHFWICEGSTGGPADTYRYRCTHCGIERDF
jgi:hypothetical protein